MFNELKDVWLCLTVFRSSPTSPATPSTTSSSLVNVPVLSKQHISTGKRKSRSWFYTVALAWLTTLSTSLQNIKPFCNYIYTSIFIVNFSHNCENENKIENTFYLTKVGHLKKNQMKGLFMSFWWSRVFISLNKHF